MAIRRFFRRRRWDEERARELASYLAEEIADNLARGLTPNEARAAAHRKLGNPTRIREEIYTFNSVHRLERLAFDLRDAWRQLRRRRAVTIATALVLLLGIAAATAAFEIAYGVLWRPIDLPQASRLVTVWAVLRGKPGQVSYPDLQDLRQLPVFESVAALGSGRGTLAAGTDVERITLADAEPGLLPMLGARAALGRMLVPADTGQAVGVISRRLWTRVFHGDAAIIGRTLQVSGRPFTVVGVLAADPEFELPVGGGGLDVAFTVKDVDVWTPLNPTEDLARSRSVTTYEALARLAPGVTLAAAQSAADTVAAALAARYPETNRDRGVRLTSLHDQMVFARGAAIRLGAAGAGLLLVMACTNAMGLTLGTLPSRRRDAALRAALGAGRGRLLTQAAWESLLLGGGAGIAGILLARALVAALTASVDLPRAAAIRFDAPVAAFAVALAIATAFVARLVPMLRLDAGPSGLRASSSVHSLASPWLRRGLVVVQVCVALVVCSAAALLGSSLRAILQIDPGFSPSGALSARVSAYPSTQQDKVAVERFFSTLVASLRDAPGIAAAGAGTSLPLTESNTGTVVMAEGQTVPESLRPTAGWQAVTPGYFAALGLPLLAGRDFSANDRRATGHHVVINRALARRLFGDADPIGRRIVLGSVAEGPDWHEVIGVVADVRHGRLTEDLRPRAYDLFGEHWSRTLYVVVRGVDAAPVSASMVRDRVARLDPAAPVFDVRTLQSLVDAGVAAPRSATIFATGLAAVCLLLSGIGVYGLVAGAVASRTREFGIRRALGASRRGIILLAAGEALAMTALGVALGSVLAAGGARLIESQLYAVSATDPGILGAIAVLLACAVAIAAFLPARAAARVHPAITLRAE